MHKQVNGNTVWADVLYDGNETTFIEWGASDLPDPNDQDWANIDLFFQHNIVTEIHIFPKHNGVGKNTYFKIYVDRTSGSVGSTLVYDHATSVLIPNTTWTIIPVSNVNGNRIVIKSYNGQGMSLAEVKVYGHSRFVNANVKIFLEGPYNSPAMNNNLGASIPLSQPYNTEPWNYNGTESTTLNFITNNNIVDWVYIELRSGTSAGTATTVVSRRAALVRNDGVILDTDGSVDIDFYGASGGDYYIAVYHRNHLSVLSSQAVNLN